MCVCVAAVGDGACRGLKRTELVVEQGKTTRLRLVNAATLVYMTVCFEKHTVTVIALDAAPVEPKSFSECVDVNTGQRWGCSACFVTCKPHFAPLTACRCEHAIVHTVKGASEHAWIAIVSSRVACLLWEVTIKRLVEQAA